MTCKIMRYIMFLCILVAVLAGPAAAHDSGSPHTHDASGDAASVFRGAGATLAPGEHSYNARAAPMAFLVIPILGETLPFHWLWHVMNGEVVNDRVHLLHEIAGWYDLPNPHRTGAPEDGADPTPSIEQLE